MPTKARSDLVSKALNVLGVTAVGQPADAEDTATVDGNVDAVLRSLAAQEIVNVPDPEFIPEEWFLQIAAVLAEQCKNEFGLAPDEVQKIEKGRAQAEGELRTMVRGRPTYEAQRALYF